ncbi:MAG: F0F1 ATP synthase subunit gamma [Actinobacteria bacterium]|nr:F0F1 ATP synthase subunit gamma [Actinomycetota bacterium]
MAGGQERILRRRIRSVQSTKKITRAMELIAASRIVRAQARVEAARPYSEQITHVIANLTGAGSEVKSPLLTPREVHRVAYIVVAGDRGLSGAYNTSVIRAAERSLQDQVAEGRDYALVLVGRKAESYFRFRNYKIDASFTGFTDEPRYEHAKEIAGAVVAAYEAGDYDRVELAYTRFVSAGRQEVVLTPLMPLDRRELGLEQPRGEDVGDEVRAPYEFEPEPAAILERLLPRYVEARLFAALLEGAASKHAAQQRAMKAATDNAADLITSYTRRMKRARQDSITTEIMEIVGGAEALRSARGRTTEPDRLLAELVRREQVSAGDIP